jgi:hypothetical protein
MLGIGNSGLLVMLIIVALALRAVLAEMPA